MSNSALLRLRSELAANGTIDMTVVDDLIEKVMSEERQEKNKYSKTITFKKVMEHVEVFQDGEFLFSADTTLEAKQELEKMGIS